MIDCFLKSNNLFNRELDPKGQRLYVSGHRKTSQICLLIFPRKMFVKNLSLSFIFVPFLLGFNKRKYATIWYRELTLWYPIKVLQHLQNKCHTEHINFGQSFCIIKNLSGVTKNTTNLSQSYICIVLCITHKSCLGLICW